jgi:hypothetical protein
MSSWNMEKDGFFLIFKKKKTKKNRGPVN